MSDDVLAGLVGVLAFVLSQVVILLFGFGMTRLAERRPGVASALVGVLIFAGFALIPVGGLAAVESYDLGRYLILGGLLLVSLGMPASILVGEAGRLPQPMRRTDWANPLLGYLAACWVLGGVCLTCFAFAVFVTTPPGSMR